MHELGVVFRIIDDLTEVGKENELEKIHSVTLQLGEVSGVVPHLLTDAWKWASDKTELMKGSELIIETLPAVTFCVVFSVDMCADGFRRRRADAPIPSKSSCICAVCSVRYSASRRKSPNLILSPLTACVILPEFRRDYFIEPCIGRESCIERYRTVSSGIDQTGSAGRISDKIHRFR